MAPTRDTAGGDTDGIRIATPYCISYTNPVPQGDTCFGRSEGRPLRGDNYAGPDVEDGARYGRPQGAGRRSAAGVSLVARLQARVVGRRPGGGDAGLLP